MLLRNKIGLFVLIGVLLISILKISGLLQPIEAAARVVLLPGAHFFAGIGFSVRDSLIGPPDLKFLKERNQELEARFVSMAVDYVKLRALEEENKSLSALIKFTQDSGFDYVPARIISRSSDPTNASVLIDKGAKDGVETGMAVVVGDGIFVGKITSLMQRVSIVTLISDRTSRVAAASVGRKNLLGLVEGRGNNVARLTLVPQGESLEPDDVIVTAGTEDKVPANLAIGLVNEVEGKPTDPFKNASLEPLAKTDSVDLVLILMPSALRSQ